MAAVAALAIDRLEHRYGDRTALAGVSLAVQPGEYVALLGPNGGGKTTLFRIISTLLTPSSGRVTVFGDDVVAHPAAARRHLGVVFQSPAIDVQLSVLENLYHHGLLYGLTGAALASRIDAALAAVGLADRAADRSGTLSGGLQRRTEIAKALLTRPSLLLLDEPTTGLDPAARRDVRDQLAALRGQGMTIVTTTHLMDEAAAAGRVVILHKGHVVADGTPASLVDAVGGDVIVVTARDPRALATRITERFGVRPEVVDDRVRLEQPAGHTFVPTLVEAFPGEIDAVSVGRPTLEDAFIHATGERLG